MEASYELAMFLTVLCILVGFICMLQHWWRRARTAPVICVQLPRTQAQAPIVIVGQSGPTTAVSFLSDQGDRAMVGPDCGGYLGERYDPQSSPDLRPRETNEKVRERAARAEKERVLAPNQVLRQTSVAAPATPARAARRSTRLSTL